MWEDLQRARNPSYGVSSSRFGGVLWELDLDFWFKELSCLGIIVDIPKKLSFEKKNFEFREKCQFQKDPRTFGAEAMKLLDFAFEGHFFERFYDIKANGSGILS